MVSTIYAITELRITGVWLLGFIATATTAAVSATLGLNFMDFMAVTLSINRRSLRPAPIPTAIRVLVSSYRLLVPETKRSAQCHSEVAFDTWEISYAPHDTQCSFRRPFSCNYVREPGARVAMARKLLVALWRYLQTGVVPTGAELKAQSN